MYHHLILPGFLILAQTYVPIGIGLGLVAIVFLFIISALISGSEMAFFSLTPLQISDIRALKTNGSKNIIKLIEKPKLLLATILVANNFVNIAIIVISTYITSYYTSTLNAPLTVLFVQVALVTLLLLLLGEIIPKIFGQRYALPFSQFMAAPMMFFRTIFYPLSVLFVKSTSLIDNRIKTKGIDITPEDFSEAIELSTYHESTTDEERKMLKGIAKFSEIDVREIMKSRLDVVAIDEETSFGALLGVIRETGYSRIPVYKETFDNVSGILYVKDLLAHLGQDEKFAWQQLLRPPFYVPENKKIDDLLKEFQERKIHLAIVVDEYGGTSGIVTLEDIIEEIVGEINDEFDTDEAAYTKTDENTYFFEAKTLLNDFCKILEMDDDIFEDVRGEAESLAGLILELAGKIPQKNEQLSIKHLTFIIDAVDRRRIKRVKVIVNR